MDDRDDAALMRISHFQPAGALPRRRHYDAQTSISIAAVTVFLVCVSLDYSPHQPYVPEAE